MLLLPALEPGLFADSQDIPLLAPPQGILGPQGLRWRLPHGLRPALSPQGPVVSLLRFPGGGSLRLRLEGAWAEGWGERRVIFPSGRARFVLTTPTGQSSGAWRPLAPGAVDLLDLAAPLDATEAIIAARVGEGGGSLVEVEVELDYEACPPPLPWLARIDAALLVTRVELSIGPPPWPLYRLQGALRTIEEGAFRWYPLKAGAPPRPPALTADALAAGLLERVATEGPLGANWAEGLSGPLDIALDVLRVQLLPHGLRWSMSAFFAAQADPSPFFPEVELPVPLRTQVLHIVQSLPLGDATVASLRLELSLGRASGAVVHTFSPGETVLRLPFLQESGAQEPRWRLIALVAGREGLVPFETPWRPVERLLLDIGPESTGIHPIEVVADPALFTFADHINVELGSRRLRLDSGRLAGWLVFREVPPVATLRARVGDREVELGSRPVVGGRLSLGLDLVGAGASVELSFHRGPLPEVAWLALQTPDGLWHSLDAGEALRWSQPQPSRLLPPTCPYRLISLRWGADGGVLAPETSEPRIGTGPRVEVAP